MRIVDSFLDAAERWPERVAFTDGKASVRYSEARRLAMRVATKLTASADTGRQKHVAILSPNDYRVSLLQLAVNHADGVWLSLHSRNTLAVQIETLEKLDCDMLFFHSSYEKMAASVLKALPAGVAAVCMDGESGIGPSLGAWLGDIGEAPLAAPENPTLPAMMQPTGGTTGPSKAVVHTHRSLEMAILAMRHGFVMTEHPVYLAAAPLTHAGGFMALAALCSGGTVVITSGFDCDAVFELIPGRNVTHMFLPPTAVYALLADPRIDETDFSSLKCFAIGAAPTAPEKFKEAVRKFGPVVYEGYGQTECLFPVLVKTPGDYLHADGRFDDAAVASAGRAVPFARLAIVDDDGRLLPAGESSEIVVRSSMVMAGYYKRGFVTIRDRKKDMIVSGGFNLYPSEIEAVIGAHPAVLDVAVIGVPDPKWGEAVKAVIELKPGRAASEDEIIALCKNAIGGMKAPKTVEFWETLPRSAVGKVLKKDIRARFWSGKWRAV